ncbi:hypothetical protein MIND_00916200 [Mycena indigotica]|uniref:F-box domain-containing protein n=1 Tax=Mycena indigotica TaxID=2126181 RepID=A0A8H6VWQ6_9AGAR|nr:uncharacterized protein MIND_00916200 [Mycena indigotica]KAF7296849.1 hypothetical protein MIND_00916200 [Mycena indigotica]
MAPASLPVELVTAIAECAPPSSLATLALSCTAFRAISEDCLYQRVVLDHRTSEQGFSWCRTVTDNPRLAQKVHSLSFILRVMLHLNEYDAETEARLLLVFVLALRGCINLRRFRLGYGLFEHPTSLYDLLGPGCPFRLTHLHLAAWDGLNDDVWTGQPALTSLVIPSWAENDLSAVANLPLVHLYAALKAVPPADNSAWQLAHAILTTSDEDEEPPSFVNLGTYAETLTNLALETHGQPDINIYAILSMLADSLPGLTTLYYDETVGSAGVREEGTIQQPLARFPHLTAFFLRFYLGSGSLVKFSGAGEGGENIDFKFEEKTSPETALQHLGTSVLATSSSLRHVEIACKMSGSSGGMRVMSSRCSMFSRVAPGAPVEVESFRDRQSNYERAFYDA